MLGYLQDPFDARDVPMGRSVASARAPGDLRPFVREVFDQRDTNSCVAQAIASAVAIRGVVRGRAWEPPSRIWTYRLAVLALGEGARDARGKLRDLGCHPRDALRAVAKLGMPPESLWPFEAERLQEQPPWALRRRAVDARFSYYRCSGVDDIRLALALRYPVVAGYRVDRAFLESRGPSVVQDFDASEVVGGHMVTLVTESPDRTSFSILNSWGTGWREGGFARLSAGLVAERTIDAWAIV